MIFVAPTMLAQAEAEPTGGLVEWALIGALGCGAVIVIVLLVLVFWLVRKRKSN